MSKLISSFSDRPAHGMTLVEVLVTIVILSIGMLGLAGLQAATSRYKINSWARSATAMLFADFADRVRANSDADKDNFFQRSTSDSPFLVTETWAAQQQSAPAKPGTDCEAPATSCKPAEQAAYDKWAWRTKVRELLPQGAALVEGNRSTGFTVTLMWLDKNNIDPTQSQDPSKPPVLRLPTTCAGDETGLAFQSCCPAAAEVSAIGGARCLRMAMVP